MGKVEVNKRNKRTSLLQTAFDLFVEQGFSKATISDISKRAGLAKGTFYLYFRDKYDLRDQLVARKSAQLMQEALKALELRPEKPRTLEDYIFGITDYILNYLQANPMLLKFISKNLSWGLFRFASAQPEDVPQLTEFYEGFLQALKADHIECEHPDLLLFTIIELIGSTGYSCIVYESPCDLKTYLPWLHQSIHQILIGYTSNGKTEKTEDSVIPRSESENHTCM